MAISYVGGQVGSRADSNATSEQTFALTGGSDSTPQDGDLVVISVVVGSAITRGATDIATPAGYTTTTELFADGVLFNTELSVNYKFMGATPDTTFTLGAGGSNDNAQAWTVHVFRGVDTTTPLDVAAVGVTGTGTARPDPGAITPVTTGAWIYIGTGSSADTGSTFTYATFTDVLTANGADTNDATVGSGYNTTWVSGPFDPAASTTGATGAADSWAAYTLAIRPAPAVVGTHSVTLGTVTGVSAGVVGDAASGGGGGAYRPRKKFTVPDEAVGDWSLGGIYGPPDEPPVKPPKLESLVGRIEYTPLASAIMRVAHAHARAAATVMPAPAVPARTKKEGDDDDDDELLYAVSMSF